MTHTHIFYRYNIGYKSRIVGISLQIYKFLFKKLIKKMYFKSLKMLIFLKYSDKLIFFKSNYSKLMSNLK